MNSVYFDNNYNSYSLGMHTDRKAVMRKNLKSMLYNMTRNELSKKSLPISLTQPMRTKKMTQKKKNKKKSPKKGTSEILLSRNNNGEEGDAINRQKLIEKLTSIRSMNNSLFFCEDMEEEEVKIDHRAIIVNTDHSMDCIDEIHNMESKMNKSKNANNVMNQGQEEKAQQTLNIIETYLALMNGEVETE